MEQPTKKVASLFCQIKLRRALMMKVQLHLVKDKQLNISEDVDQIFS